MNPKFNSHAVLEAANNEAIRKTAGAIHYGRAIALQYAQNLSGEPLSKEAADGVLESCLVPAAIETVAKTAGLKDMYEKAKGGVKAVGSHIARNKGKYIAGSLVAGAGAAYAAKKHMDSKKEAEEKDAGLKELASKAKEKLMGAGKAVGSAVKKHPYIAGGLAAAGAAGGYAAYKHHKNKKDGE